MKFFIKIDFNLAICMKKTVEKFYINLKLLC